MYCCNCGYQIADNANFCDKCGTPVNVPGTPQVKLPPEQRRKAPIQQPPIYQTRQQTPNYQSPMSMDRDIWGRFGGFMVFGALVIIMVILGTASSEYFLHPRNFSNIGMQLLRFIIMAFSVGLTVKHKGLDFSFAGMVGLTSVICCMTQTLALGILLSLLACIIVGVINSVCIHFLKLPGMLVTIVTYFILTLVYRALTTGIMINPINIEPSLMYLVALIAVVVGVGIALLSSIGKDHRNRFSSTLMVYVGSSILAVLYMIGYIIRLEARYPEHPSMSIIPLLLIGIFLCITRFFKSKALGAVFAIIPAVVYLLIKDVFGLVKMDIYVQALFFIGLVWILISVSYYKVRAQLVGQSLEKRYSMKSWIVLIPLVLLDLRDVVMIVTNFVNEGKYSLFELRLTSVYADVVLLLVAVGACITYVFTKPKGSNIV